MDNLIESVISGMKQLEEDFQESRDRLDFYRVARKYGFFNIKLLKEERLERLGR